MEEEFVQLKWNTHQLAFFNTLSSLRDKQVYTDVTLSCGDQFYPAHRLVLSACSTFFARTLEVASCRAPVILLHGIDQSTLEELLMFMYDGQVTISRNDLPKLLIAAQWLGVKGLDAAHDRQGADDDPNEPQSLSEHLDSSQILEGWKQFISLFTNVSSQSESTENGVKLCKQITGRMQELEDPDDQNSKSESELSEVKSNQETDKQDNIPGADIIINSITGSASEIINSYSCTEQMEESNSNNSFEGWMENETYKNYDLKDMIASHDETVEINSANCSSSPDEYTESKSNKVNGAADTNKRSLRCKHCRMSFKVRKDLARHLRIHHDHTKNYCFSCHMKFISKKEFNSHMKLHKAEKLHSCNLCEFVSHSLYGLRKHFSVHHSTSSESDAIFPKVELIVESEQKTKDLQRTFNNSGGLKCSICLKIFKNETILKTHRDRGCSGIIRSEKGYHCPVCMYVADRLRSVEDHLARHTGVYRFRCSYCPYQCVRNGVLQEHISKRHPELI